MRALWCALLALFIGPAFAAAGGPQQDDAFVWLQKIAAAAHQLNYSGSFVYQHDNHVETFRITHLVDEGGEHEKLAVLDGSPRDVYRNNEQVLCFLPDNKTVIVEKRRTRKSFPAILPAAISELSEYYQVRMGGQDRIAGHECQLVILDPKDAFRYGHKLWADSKTGLLLRASTFNENNETVDQFAFTQLDIGGAINKAEVKPQLAGKKLIEQTDRTGNTAAIDAGWQIGSPPPGFKKTMEVKRMLPGSKSPVNHIMFSDGLAAVSIFIEPLDGDNVRPAQELSNTGALHVYTIPVGDSRVRVLGEVPGATVMQFGNSVSYTRK